MRMRRDRLATSWLPTKAQDAIAVSHYSIAGNSERYERFGFVNFLKVDEPETLLLSDSNLLRSTNRVETPTNW